MCTIFLFSGHIFFDDAMELDEKDEFVPNNFVRTMVGVISEAGR